ncbi:hypothetical protein [uncultured Lactobacillus sp.]|uniref:hypothetical protein n=1 Tax=uncultured Lactobacillus sp. TaxID=153152 RepID=UPI0023BBE3F1|nr:hypothetical protein [uncultured Lactobacillus sp.]MDE7056137.1 hypothetical protein [Lactobacillus sp.]
MKKTKSFIASKTAGVKFLISMLSAYATSKMVILFAIPAFAEADSSDAFNTHVNPTNGAQATDVVAGLFNGFVAPLQAFVAVILVIATVICGLKIGVSAMTSDPRSRTSAIEGIAFIIIGAVVVVHARSIVGMASGIATSNQQ